jgi:hypothetical protein
MRTCALRFLLLAALAGCSSNEAPSATGGDASAADAGAVDAAPEAAPIPDAAADAQVAPDPCPGVEPIPGFACAPQGTACEYGTDPHAVCWTFASCQQSDAGDLEWADSDPILNCTPDNDARCPAAFGAAAACPANPLRCDYPEGRCTCVPCVGAEGGAGMSWACRHWTDVGVGGTPGPAACPANRPHLEDPCSAEGTSCFYDSSCTGIVLGPGMKCSHGRWVPAPDPAFACTVRKCE